MYGMRGTSSLKTRLAAVLSVIVLLSLFTMVSMSLVYASTHGVDYSAAVHLTAESDENVICEERVSRGDGPITSGKNHTIINIAGPLTGLGWWRETLRSFAIEEGLMFGEGDVDSMDCTSDIHQIESFNEDDLLRLPKPYKGTLIIRDLRSVILEHWLLAQVECRKLLRNRPFLPSRSNGLTSAQTDKVCRLTKEAGISYVLMALVEKGCHGPLQFSCIATSIAARVAESNGLKVFKYEELWSGNPLALTSLGLWYGLQGQQLDRFISVGRLWTEEFHKIMDNSVFLRVRKSNAWNQHFTAAHVKLFNKKLGKVSESLGYVI